MTGVPWGWELDTEHAGGTAIALVPHGFTAWSGLHLGGQGAEGDFHGDGLPNLLRYALDIDPAVPSGFPGVFEGGTLTFMKRPDAVANGDVSYLIESSPDLSPGSWTPVTPDIDNDEMISFTAPTGSDRLFLRLVVAPAP